MRRLFATAILMLTIGPAAAYGWNPAGHMAIASIAYDGLSPAQRQALVTILRGHPRFQQDFQSAMPAGLSPAQQDRWIVMRAAAWPDLARVFVGEDQKTFSRPAWHYVDIPLYLNDAARQRIHPPPIDFDDRNAGSDASMNVVQALGRASSQLADPHTPAATRAVAACWVLHLAADVHQPLHGATLYAAERFRMVPVGDKGGNDIPIVQTAIPVPPGRTANLHWLWDSILGTDESYTAATEIADDLERASPRKDLADGLKATHPKDWAGESHDLAARKVYTPEIMQTVEAGEAHPHAPLPPIKIGDDYLAMARPIARQRAALAGYRLADLIDRARIAP